MLRRPVLSLACLCLLAAALRAEEDYAGQVREARDKVNWLKDQVSALPGQAEWAGLFARADLRTAQEVARVEIEHWEQLARLYEQKEGVRARELRARDYELARATNSWKSRLEIRHWQNQVAPGESWYNGTRANCPKGAIAALDALARAKRKAAEAWDALAEATTSDTAPAQLEEMKDRAMTLAGEVDTAQVDYDWTLWRERICDDQTLSSDEIRRWTDELTEVQRKRVQLRREQAAREQETRKLEAQRGRLEEGLRKAYDEARRRREEEKRRK